MFRINMLAAGHGDCLWIEYGAEQSPHRVLIDGGTAPTYRRLKELIVGLAPEERRFELLIVTHVDADHIEGVVRLLGDRALGVEFDEVWFNGWRHLPAEEDDRLGPVQGEYLSALIESRRIRWNGAFGSGPVVIKRPEPLPRHDLPGGLRLTLLSPAEEQLARLKPKWQREVERAGLAPGVAREALEELEKKRRLQPDALGEERVDVRALAETRFVSDSAEANGSSIAVLAEYEDKRCLLTGDAFAPVLSDSIGQLLDDRGLERLRLDACKLPHHGSQANLSIELLGLLNCSRYLFSTSGSIFNHPDAESVARVIVHGGRRPALFFNYRSEENEIWDDAALRARYDYRVHYPPAGGAGLVVEL